MVCFRVCCGYWMLGSHFFKPGGPSKRAGEQERKCGVEAFRNKAQTLFTELWVQQDADYSCRGVASLLSTGARSRLGGTHSNGDQPGASALHTSTRDLGADRHPLTFTRDTTHLWNSSSSKHLLSYFWKGWEGRKTVCLLTLKKNSMKPNLKWKGKNFNVGLSATHRNHTHLLPNRPVHKTPEECQFYGQSFSPPDWRERCMYNR